MPRPSDQPVHRAPLTLTRVRVAEMQQRVWLQAFGERATWVVVVGLGTAAILLPLVRISALPDRWDVALELLAAGAAFAALARAAWHRLGRLDAARRLDDLGKGSDRLATALWLETQPEADAWTQVQAHSAETFAQTLDVPSLLPWRWPGAARALPWAALVAAVGFFAPVAWLLPHLADPDGRGRQLSGLVLGLPAGPLAFRSAAELLGADTVDLLRTDLRLLEHLEAQVEEPRTRQWLRDVRDVVEKVADGRIDKRQAMDLLADLESRRPADALADAPAPSADQPARDPAQAQHERDLALRNAVSEAAKAAAEVAPKGAEAEAIKQAADQKDLGALARLAEALADKNMSDRELEKWIKAVERFASALGDQKVPRKFKDLAERIERLQQKKAQEGGLGRSDQERLQSARHDLEQLRKTQGDPQAAEHAVERLERGAHAAAEELRRSQQDSRLGQKSRQSDAAQPGQSAAQTMKNQLRAAAEELRRENRSEQSRQAERIGQARMRDVREALERAAGRSEQRESFEQRAAGGQPQRAPGDKSRLQDKAPQGQGKEAPGSPQQAAGQGHGKGKEEQGFRLGQGRLGDRSRMEELREAARQPASAGQGKGGQRGEPGDGAGDEPGDQAQDNSARRLGGGQRQKLQGQEGQGPDTKRVFVDAARKGFARQGWRQVYVEYSEVAQEMLDKERLPPGRRAAVQRYFELIRPR